MSYSYRVSPDERMPLEEWAAQVGLISRHQVMEAVKAAFPLVGEKRQGLGYSTIRSAYQGKPIARSSALLIRDTLRQRGLRGLELENISNLQIRDWKRSFGVIPGSRRHRQGLYKNDGKAHKTVSDLSTLPPAWTKTKAR